MSALPLAPAMQTSRCVCGETRTARVLGDVCCTERRTPFSILACDACALWRTDPVPADLASAYAGAAGRQMRHGETGLFAALQRVQLGREIRRVRHLAESDAVLDIGAGSGSFARVLLAGGARVWTTDAPGVAAPVAETSHLEVDFESGDIRGLPEGRYTAVLRHVLEHVRDPKCFLRRLQAQGVESVYVVVPNADCLERKLLGRSWFLWDPPRHLWHFHRASLRTVCENAGLEILAEGRDTIGNLAPSAYRALTLAGRTRWAAYVAPRGFANAVAAPLNALLPGNVLWLLARRASTAPDLRTRRE